MAVSGVSQAYKGWFNTEPVTVTFQRGAAEPVDVALSIAKKKNTTLKEAEALGVQLAGGETTWHLPEVLLAADENYPGQVERPDKITQANGTVWVVGVANLETYDTRWRCICTKARADS